ncbi:MAG: 4'-phosphopantetheinyl transferase family protein [Rhodanobacter sp.]
MTAQDRSSRSSFERGGQDALLRRARWLEVGDDDPRLPPAFVIEFSSAAFAPAAFEQHGVPLPSVLRKAVPKRQAEFLAGRIAARQAVERLGVAAAIPGIGSSREPLWQAGVKGSITHTRDLAGAIAVDASAVRGIGIDFEDVIEAAAREAVRELAFTSRELALLDERHAQLSGDMLLTIAFSAKESLFKGAHAAAGRYFDFSAAFVSAVDADAGRLTLTLAETLCPDLPEGSSHPVCFRLLRPNTIATSFIW